MADEVNSSWEPEEIPNQDLLWMRVHRMWFRDGVVMPGAFQNRPTPQDGMSTDWEKYAKPEETRSRAKNPQQNAVIQLSVEEVRQIPDQTVIHTPLLNNRAHTDVFGEKGTEARLHLTRIWKLVIPVEHP